MLRYRYYLSPAGEERCDKNQFYLQATPKYRGFTPRVFRAIRKEAKTIAEIATDIKPFYPGVNYSDLKRSVNGVITFNVAQDYIRRLQIL